MLLLLLLLEAKELHTTVASVSHHRVLYHRLLTLEQGRLGFILAGAPRFCSSTTVVELALQSPLARLRF